MRFAEEANYWNTTVHPAKSQAEIVEMLEDFGVNNIVMMQGKTGSRLAWLIRFQWQGKPYRFVFTPLACKNPQKTYSFGGKRRSADEQARYQMGRIATHFVKAILTAAETNPDAMFGFLELASKNTSDRMLPPTAAEINIDELTSSTPSMIMLPGVIDNNYIDGE